MTAFHILSRSCLLAQGDCLQLMPTLPDASIDMILCDLPYGTTGFAWDAIIPFDLLWEQYKRLIKPNGAIVLFGLSAVYQRSGYEQSEMVSL